MAVSPSKKSSWQKQAAVVISDSPNMHMLLRELLRSYSWTVVESTASSKAAGDLVRQGLANMVIIDDTAKSPSFLHARYLMSDPVTLLTPVLAFLAPSREHEETALAKLGAPAIVYKPLTPAKFLPVFVKLLRNWEKEPLLSLRRANYMFLQGDEAKALMGLAKLMQVPELQHLCGQAIALNLRRSGKLKEAERVLLTTLKRSPRELGTILTLADLYMFAAMPKLAHRLLLGARSAFNQSLAMVPDLVQAALMMGRIDDAIQSLNLLVKGTEVDEMTLSFLGRLLYADGRELEAERLVAGSGFSFKKLHNAWQLADPPPSTAAAS